LNLCFTKSWLWFFFSFVSIADAHAAGFSFPLNGYYHPGRFMPAAFGAGTELRLAADSAVTTLIQSPRGGIAPWLVIAPPRDGTELTASLHELTPDERLIGYATDAPFVAQDLFPNDSVVRVTLDPANPVPGPAGAWGTLDALVVDTAAFARFPSDEPDNLLAGGTSLAVRALGSSPPDDDRPWRLVHGFWICRAQPGLVATISDAAYAPASNFEPGRPARYRTQVVLLGAMFGIVMLAISIVPRPRTILRRILLIELIGGVSGLAIGGFVLWDKWQPDLSAAQGYVESINGDRTFMDDWSFQRALKSGQLTRPETGGLELPFLSDRGGPADLTLVCGGDGMPIEFRYRLDGDNAAAFAYRRLVWDATIPTTLDPATSPLSSLAASLYPGEKILGQSPLATSPSYGGLLAWPDLVLESSDAMPRN
jgi:hypothetical protein